MKRDNWVLIGIIFMFLVLGSIMYAMIKTTDKPKFTHPTFTQHQQLELRVERLEKVVGLKGEEVRKEGIQHKIK